MGPNNRVKFGCQELKYDLEDLFNNRPKFEETVPQYSKITEYIPPKLSYPHQKRNDAD